MKKTLNEFKEFIMRGNVMNLAVGIIIGSAFQSVVTSLTDNLISPVVGIFASQNFDSLELQILGTTLRYGAFITSVINFLIMAAIVFCLVKAMNKLTSIGKKKSEEKPKPKRFCQYCKTEVNPEATRCPACTSEL